MTNLEYINNYRPAADEREIDETKFANAVITC